MTGRRVNDATATEACRLCAARVPLHLLLQYCAFVLRWSPSLQWSSVLLALSLWQHCTSLGDLSSPSILLYLLLHYWHHTPPPLALHSCCVIMVDMKEAKMNDEPMPTENSNMHYGGCEGPDAMYVKLISADKQEFIIKRSYALTSGTIKAMLSGPGRYIFFYNHLKKYLLVIHRTIFGEWNQWSQLSGDPFSYTAKGLRIFYLQSTICQQLNWNSWIPNRSRNCSGTSHGRQLLGLLKWNQLRNRRNWILKYNYFITYI